MRSIALMTALAMTLFVAGCGDDDDGPTGPGAAPEFDVIQPAVDAYTGGDKAATISAQALFDNLNDGDASNDPTIVSVRSAEHYALGHIAGALNIPWREIADPAKLAMLSKSDEIVIYCYTGHTGGVATASLNAMGYAATNLKFGMMGWTKDTTVRVAAAFNEATDAHDFTIETTANAGGTYDLADPDYTSSTVEEIILQASVDNYVTASDATITAQAIFDNLNDGNASNDPIIVSVRAAEHYAIGHLPGAINIPWREIAKSESLTKLPTDRQIAVYCYTGHTGAVATTALNLLGYDAVNMKWGILSWTTDPTVRVAGPFSESGAMDFPVTQ